jgi:hypothetical protein
MSIVALITISCSTPLITHTSSTSDDWGKALHARKRYTLRLGVWKCGRHLPLELLTDCLCNCCRVIRALCLGLNARRDIAREVTHSAHPILIR